ncbi:Dolichyldiphosphatase 1 [Fragariocoptes setiger]|uniref:Dolichyldiphosphatase 1 n=1 Tax=Fragariocoptes setiger TaxID=1670756 RepID=A0ABQ7SB10_9ACAR|nr:Dolichyldiphosphatase 1 [Fragariocoptes setiger]
MDANVSIAGQWITKELVVIRYLEGDWISLFFALYSTLVVEIHAVYVTLFLWNRDLLTTYCCSTHLVSEIISYCLKRYLKHDRPIDAPGGGTGFLEGKYGMPSQHCHCFAYLGTMILLLVYHYYRSATTKRWRAFCLVSVIIGVAIQIAARVYLNYHTLTQCFSGVALGLFNATLFYLAGLVLLRYFADSLCDLALLKVLNFRKDLSTLTHVKPITKAEKAARRMREALKQHRS